MSCRWCGETVNCKKSKCKFYIPSDYDRYKQKNFDSKIKKTLTKNILKSKKG